jgi:hypothetical protein
VNDIVENPFAGNAGQGNAGALAVQSRENAEVMAMAVMAKRFPRDPIVACDRIKNAFTRPSLAEKAQYQFARGGSDIVGPSIHSAQAIAQQWGNMSNGWREVSRYVGPDGVGVSEVEAFSVDYETVNREAITFHVRHWRDTKSGGYKLKDERDIYELCANQAQRRKRACILAQLPGDIVDMAMQQAGVTLKSKADTSPEAMAKMLEAFALFGVTKEHIEKRIQRRLDSIQAAQVVQLKRIYASLRDDMSVPEDWFEMTLAAGAAEPATQKPEAKEQPAYPADLFTKNLAGWRKLIGEGKKTVAQIEAMTRTKGAFTAEQLEALNAKDQPTGGAPADDKPAVTYAKVADMLNAAENSGSLDDAAALISAVADKQQQTELNALYDKRLAELQG